MLKEALNQLIERINFSQDEIEHCFDELLSTSSPEALAAFLVLLRSKGETVEEITGIVRAMQKTMIAIDVPFPVLDIVGTGGDHANTVNISTGSALVAASCGVKIAKHGNRSVSSLCGSADVLEALGISIDLGPNKVLESIEKCGIGFMFAPNYHPAFRQIAPVRRNIKVRTVFNLVGPLLNPAKAEYMMAGVFDPGLIDKFARVLKQLGTKRALVFHSNGLDELSSCGTSAVAEVGPEGIRHYRIDPVKLGLKLCKRQDLLGGTAEENALLLEKAFQGEQGPISDNLALNAGAALYVYGAAETLGEGLQIASEALRLGRPYECLEKWRSVCRAF